MDSHLKARIAATAAIAIGAALVSAPAFTQGSNTPVARYTLDAGTISGMGAMGQGGGVSAAMAMMRGQGGGRAHELVLRLGSTRSPTGSPAATHTLPSGARFGPTLPLVTPQQEGRSGEYSPQTPKGRLLLYWGCGERAGPGQPVVIDFAKLAKGEIPPGLFMSGVDLAEDWQVGIANSRTYTNWPNGDDRKTVPANGSLLGAHKITANYSKEIAFTLGEDFMPPLQAGTSNTAAGGSKQPFQIFAGSTRVLVP